MIKETKLYKILSFIHLILVTSLFLGTITILSLGILFLPALCAVFHMGKELIFDRYNVNDGILKILFSELRNHIRIIRFLPAQILLVVQCVGIYFAGLQGMNIIQILLLASGAFLLIYMIYTCGYEVFLGKDYTWFNVILAMFYRFNYFLTLWVLAILILLFVQPGAIKYIFVGGGFIVFLVEVVVFLALISYKEALGLHIPEYDDEEMPGWFALLVKRK